MKWVLSSSSGKELKATYDVLKRFLFSPKYKNQGLVEARISYTELTSVGQAFRVGR